MGRDQTGECRFVAATKGSKDFEFFGGGTEGNCRLCDGYSGRGVTGPFGGHMTHLAESGEPTLFHRGQVRTSANMSQPMDFVKLSPLP